MDKDYIDYDGNDNTISQLRNYKKELELNEFTKEQQTYLISELVDKLVGMLLETLQKESDELDELTAKFNLLLAIGRVSNDEKEQFKMIKTYKTNTIRFFTRNSNDLVKKMYKFRDELKNG